MGGRGASASFGTMKATQYVKTFSDSLTLSEMDKRFLSSQSVVGATQSVSHFKSPSGTVKTNISIRNGKEFYELKQGNKVLLKSSNKKQIVNRIANLYVIANKKASKE